MNLAVEASGGASDTLAADFIADPSSDRLDAVLCGVQTAWACAQPDFGIPSECHLAEGWIVDPDMLSEW
jgi:hypothetical protein